MSGFFGPAPVLIAGPCALEHDEVNLEIGEVLSGLAGRLGLRVVYKGSFDKANRASPRAPRGLGLEGGLAALALVRKRTGLPVLTDVHEPGQVPAVAAVVDAIQVPALLARQTDLLVAAGRSGLPVNVKKGQSMAPSDMRGAVTKVREAGGRDVSVTERGSFFGYGDLVVDMRNFDRIRQAAGTPVFFDATHSVQQPGQGVGGASGGTSEHVPALLRAAAAAGADGFYLETHPRPHTAPSDGATMWPLGDLEGLIESALDVWRAAHAARARA
ncbi:MAG: 3-deoxy-8-phosphooctulonate synthase [Gemmatimonadetes bacterium]|nr:3-deoxy-8-phosphooctulonate synthase [Gemmatimonadota bacterium]